VILGFRRWAPAAAATYICIGALGHLLDRARAVPWAEATAQARPGVSGHASTGPSIAGPSRAVSGQNPVPTGRRPYGDLYLQGISQIIFYR